MPPLPVLSGDEFCKAIGSLGYSLDHFTGSHMILRNPSGQRLSVPRHKELDRGTLRSLIRQAGLTVDEFVRLL